MQISSWRIIKSVVGGEPAACLAENIFLTLLNRFLHQSCIIGFGRSACTNVVWHVHGSWPKLILYLSAYLGLLILKARGWY